MTTMHDKELTLCRQERYLSYTFILYVIYHISKRDTVLHIWSLSEAHFTDKNQPLTYTLGRYDYLPMT